MQFRIKRVKKVVVQLSLGNDIILQNFVVSEQTLLPRSPGRTFSGIAIDRKKIVEHDRIYIIFAVNTFMWYTFDATPR